MWLLLLFFRAIKHLPPSSCPLVPSFLINLNTFRALKSPFSHPSVPVTDSISVWHIHATSHTFWKKFLCLYLLQDTLTQAFQHYQEWIHILPGSSTRCLLTEIVFKWLFSLPSPFHLGWHSLTRQQGWIHMMVQRFFAVCPMLLFSWLSTLESGVALSMTYCYGGSPKCLQANNNLKSTLIIRNQYRNRTTVHNQTTETNMKQWGRSNPKSNNTLTTVNKLQSCCTRWVYYYHTTTQEWWSTACTHSFERQACLTQGYQEEIITCPSQGKGSLKDIFWRNNHSPRRKWRLLVSRSLLR